MTVRIFFLTFILLVAAAKAVTAQSGAATLQNLVGGSAAGMAEAFSTAEDDIAAWPYNPGSLATLRNPQIAGTFSRGLASDSLSMISYGQPTSAGTFAGTFAYYDTGKEELFASDGGVYNIHLQRDILGALSYADRSGMLSVGATAKFLRSELAEAANATTFAMDFGGVIGFPSSGFSAGAALRNVGPGLKFIDKRDPLPLELRFGGSYVLPLGTRRSKLLLSADIPYLMNDKAVSGKIGAEYAYLDSLSFRAGYHVKSDAQDIALGVGVRWQQIEFNYGFGLADELSNTQRITVGYRFGDNAGTGNTDMLKANQNRDGTLVQPPVAIQELLAGLRSPDWEERRKAAFELGKAKAAEAAGPLLKLLDDENEKVCGAAALALGRIGDRRALKPLIEKLEDGPNSVRASAAKALGDLGDNRAAKALKAALKDDSEKVRQTAGAALEKLGGQ